jgi:hypothetical protein
VQPNAASLPCVVADLCGFTEGAELKEAIKRQVEFYFSRANLANDAYLVSQMNSQM